MQPTGIASSAPHMTINFDQLDELRRAFKIKSEKELAERIGVDSITLYRVRNGKVVPSNQFLTKVIVAFPPANRDDLIRVVTA